MRIQSEPDDVGALRARIPSLRVSLPRVMSATRLCRIGKLVLLNVSGVLRHSAEHVTDHLADVIARDASPGIEGEWGVRFCSNSNSSCVNDQRSASSCFRPSAVSWASPASPLGMRGGRCPQALATEWQLWVLEAGGDGEVSRSQMAMAAHDTNSGSGPTMDHPREVGGFAREGGEEGFLWLLSRSRIR